MSDSDSSSKISCALCENNMDKWTPCCHEPLCESCCDKMLVEECWICNTGNQICKVCFARNSYSNSKCEYCKKRVSPFCEQHDEIKINSCCKQRLTNYFQDCCEAFLGPKWLKYLDTMSIKEQAKYVNRHSKRKLLRDIANALIIQKTS